MIPKPMNLFPNHHYNRARPYLILEIQAKKINCFMIAVKILIAKIRKIILTMISRLVKSGRDVKLIKRTEKDKWTRKNNTNIEAFMLSVFLYMGKGSHMVTIRPIFLSWMYLIIRPCSDQHI